MHIKSLVSSIALSMIALSSQAASTQWGLHDELEIGVGFTSPGAFNDVYSFAIQKDTTVMSTTVSNNLGSLLNITGGTVSLFKEMGVNDLLLGSYSFDGTTGSTSHDFFASAPGAYFYSVTGIATGSKGGFYSISSTASTTAVPEPDAYLLMLSALGVAGLVHQRRKASK